MTRFYWTKNGQIPFSWCLEHIMNVSHARKTCTKFTRESNDLHILQIAKSTQAYTWERVWENEWRHFTRDDMKKKMESSISTPPLQTTQVVCQFIVYIFSGNFYRNHIRYFSKSTISSSYIVNCRFWIREPHSIWNLCNMQSLLNTSIQRFVSWGSIMIWIFDKRNIRLVLITWANIFVESSIRSQY